MEIHVKSIFYNISSQVGAASMARKLSSCLIWAPNLQCCNSRVQSSPATGEPVHLGPTDHREIHVGPIKIKDSQVYRFLQSLKGINRMLHMVDLLTLV